MTKIYGLYGGIRYQSALTSSHLVKHRSLSIQSIQQQQTPTEYINPFESSLQSKYNLLWSKSVKNPSSGDLSTLSALQILDVDILPSKTTSNTIQKHKDINAIDSTNDKIHLQPTMQHKQEMKLMQERMRAMAAVCANRSEDGQQGTPHLSGSSAPEEPPLPQDMEGVSRGAEPG